MNVRLVVERGRRRLQVVQLRQAEAVIGRERGSAVRVPSAEVSRRHCRLRVRGGVVTVEDLASVNGTFLNGARVADTQVVYPGDRLGVGPVTFVVEYELTPEARGRLRDGSGFEILDDDEGAELLEVAEPDGGGADLELITLDEEDWLPEVLEPADDPDEEGPGPAR